MKNPNQRLVQDGFIDQKKQIHFTFNNKNYTGVSGDTLASALLANNVRIVGRSFKLHRPRGIMAAGVEECNAYVQVNSGDRHSTNVNATQIEIYEGLRAQSIHC